MIVRALAKWAFLAGVIVSGTMLFVAEAAADKPVDVTQYIPT